MPYLHYNFCAMSKQITIKILPHQANDETEIKRYIQLTTGLKTFTNYKILKKSIDARSKTIWVNLTIEVFGKLLPNNEHNNVQAFNTLKKGAKKVIIIGAGPAGIFAALQLIQLGIQPIIIERGKDVRSRRRDLAILNKEGIINPESNYCYGEGGAGTYSDGKLYTRSNKRGNIKRILDLFVQFGADEKILYEAHPHIGTNKLPQIITAMRHCIEENGGLFLFEKKMIDFTIENNKIKNVITADGDTLNADAYILATGHSARDIFNLLYKKNILIEAKPFALGVRIEHPQQIIDTAQYKCTIRDENLPPASYSLVHQVQQKGVFSFCMCPGGIIATASTAANELVVNGWSPSKRNNPYANSGMVVEVNLKDLTQLKNYTPNFNTIEEISTPLSMLHFQKIVEEKAYQAGGGKFVAPAQRLVDFAENKTSTTLPNASYLPGLNSSNINEVLPKFINERLAAGFKEFGKKLKGYYTNEAIIVATESRTSSPVKIPRDIETLTHPQLENLYPCGEGAGYAGGIVSACMDGERCAVAISKLVGSF
jgi:uncharacterized protein